MKKIIGIVTPILLLILPYLLFVVLSVGMGRPDRDSSGAYIMAVSYTHLTLPTIA